ncbi:MAG: hypothetical protein AB1736_13975 [Chloroflexota bacterium]
MTDRPPPSDPGARVGMVVLGRDRRLRAQVVAIAAVGLVIVLGGLGLGSPPAETASPRPSGPARTVAPTRTAPASAAAVSPSVGPAAACLPVAPDDPLPAVRLRSTSGDQAAVPGSAGAAPSDQPDGSPAPAGWTVPGLERGILLPSGASLVVEAGRSACLTSVAVALAAADAADPGTAATDLRTVRPERLADELDLGGLPGGDWVVRLAIEFARVPQRGGEAGEPRIAFFRVVSGDVPVLAPSPQVTPAVACGPDPLGSGPPGLVLVIDDGPPILAQDGGGAGGPVAVRLGQAIEVWAVGDVCARGWSLEVADGVGNAFLQESYPNPVDNPFLAAQNRWTLTQLLIGDSTVSATIRFGRDRLVAGTWRLRLEAPALAAAMANGPTGPGVPVLPGCGQFWDYPGGTAFEPCFVQSVPDDLEPLDVVAGSVVRIELDGWSVVEWFARCGAERVGASAPSEFTTLDECDLGGRSGGVTIAFVPWPGERLILIGITAHRDGITAYGNYYLRVRAAP